MNTCKIRCPQNAPWYFPSASTKRCPSGRYQVDARFVNRRSGAVKQVTFWLASKSGHHAFFLAICEILASGRNPQEFHGMELPTVFCECARCQEEKAAMQPEPPRFQMSTVLSVVE